MLGGTVAGVTVGVAAGAAVASAGVAAAVGSGVGRGVAVGGVGVVGGVVGWGVDVAISTATPPGMPITMLGVATAAEPGSRESASTKMTTTLRMTRVQRASTPYRIVRSLGWAGRLLAIPEQTGLDA